MFGLGLAFCVCFAVSAGTSAYVWFRFLLSVYVLLFHLGHQFVFGLGSFCDFSIFCVHCLVVVSLVVGNSVIDV